MSHHRNPLMMLVGKTRVGQDEADEIALPTMIYLDAAKRGVCPNAGYNALATAILTAAGIASQTHSKRFYDIANSAYQLLAKAGSRPTATLDLTTGEYNAIRSAIAWYVRSLPLVCIDVFNNADKHARAIMAH